MLLNRATVLALTLLLSGCYKTESLQYYDIENDKLRSSSANLIDGKFKRVEFSNLGDDLELSVIGPLPLEYKVAKARIKEKILSIEHLFAGAAVPNEDRLTKIATRCSEDFAPMVDREDNDQMIRQSAVLFANSRKTMGACLEEEVFYQASQIFLYCKKPKTYYELKLYSKNRKRKILKELSEAFVCKS